MNDTLTQEPTPAPKTPRSYAVNHGFAVALDESLAVNTTALAPEFSAAMLKKQITPAFLDEQKTDIQRARAMIQTAVSQRNAGKSGTQQKSAARSHMEALLSGVQAAAAQKYLLSNPDKVRDFYYGANIGDADTAELQIIADGVVEQLKHDDLPGIDAQDEEEIDDAVEAWEAEVARQNAGSGAQTTQDSLESLLKVVKGRTQITKLAADGLFPYSKPENAETRRRFKLPATKPYRPPLPKKPAL